MYHVRPTEAETWKTFKDYGIKFKLNDIKKLELQNFGVQEMDAKEMTLENGGRFSLGDYLVGHLIDAWVEI